MKNNTNLLFTLIIGLVLTTLFTQCGEEAKSTTNKVADKTGEMADDAADAVNKTADKAGDMAGDAAKKVEDMAGMDAKDGSLSFDQGTWGYNVLQGLSSGNTTTFTLDQIPYEGEELSDAGAEQLDNLASILKANPNWAIEVQGHSEKADNAVGGAKKKATSKLRAAWVQTKMNVRGITGKQISSKGYGDENLLAGLEPKDTKHRRITIALTKNAE